MSDDPDDEPCEECCGPGCVCGCHVEAPASLRLRLTFTEGRLAAAEEELHRVKAELKQAREWHALRTESEGIEHARALTAERRLQESERKRAALRESLRIQDPRNASELYDRIAEDFAHKTGVMAPGKSIPLGMGTMEADSIRNEKWRPFVNAWHERFFDAALALDADEAKGAT